MIYVHNSRHLQQVFIPLHGTMPDGACTLLLHGEVSLKDTEVALHTMSAERQYICVRFRLPKKMAKGEYTYSLRCGDAQLSSGVAQLGGYEDKAEQIVIDKQYKQYGA